MIKTIKTWTNACLKGFGQIMLQGNIWTGLLFIVAIFYDSFWMGVAGVVSNLIAIAMAKILRFDDKDIENGLYGFNASLTGVALVFYFELNVWVWCAIVCGAILSALLMGYALSKKIPVFTFPFIVVTLALLYLLSIPELALRTVPEHFVDIQEMDDFLIEGHAFGQVIFQGSLVAGIIFFIGVFISSPIAALYAFVAVVISVSISHHGHESTTMINEGIFSFNAVLCGIALSGPRPKDGIFVLIAVVISTYFDLFLIHNGWTTLTLPFVVATWATLPFKKLDQWISSKFVKVS